MDLRVAYKLDASEAPEEGAIHFPEEGGKETFYAPCICLVPFNKR
jgi:hypothetical protein